MRSLQKVLHIAHFQFYNFLFWSLLCVFEISKNYSFILYNNIPFETGKLIILTVSRYIIYWILSYWVFDQYLKTRQKKKSEFLMYHAVAGFLYALIHKMMSDITGILLQRLFLGQNAGEMTEIIRHWNSIFFDIPGNFIFYSGIILFLLGLDYYRKFVDEHTRYLETESQLSKAQLESLKMQLNPHFLFNAFHTISMMVRKGEKEAAVKMISGLSDMLRQSLETDSKQFVTLKEETDLLKKYLMIESERYRDRLVIEWQVDEELFTYKVPSLILQPIVENAFKHGISKNVEKSILRISIKRKDDKLIMEVFNTGSFLPINWDLSKNQGVGLANTINRLMKLYNKDYKIQISEKSRGVAVTVQIPISNN